MQFVAVSHRLHGRISGVKLLRVQQITHHGSGCPENEDDCTGGQTQFCVELLREDSTHARMSFRTSPASAPLIWQGGFALLRVRGELT